MSSELNPGQFILGGKTSKSLKTIIQNRPVITKPKRKTNLVPVPGRNGDLIFDENSYENGLIDLVAYVKSYNEEEKEINHDAVSFAFDTGRYQTFTPYWDNKYEYQAITVGGPSFYGKRTHGFFEPFEVQLSYKPFKKLRGVANVYLTKAGSVTNPFNYESLPYIKITASGDVTLKINGISFVLKNVVGFIELDSEIEECFKLDSGVMKNENDKMFSIDFPVFGKGTNTISWTGNVTNVEIEPRWRTR